MRSITYNPETKEFDATLDGICVGSFRNHLAAEIALIQLEYDFLAQGIRLFQEVA